MTIASIYGDWRLYNELIVRAVGAMSPEELALSISTGDGTGSADWPIWAIAGHSASTRVYWLADVAGVAGAEATPFGGGDGAGWEDDLSHPRSAEELAAAWTTSWSIVERALAEWRPDDLDEPVAVGPGGASHLTRRSILLRLITHEAFHMGQIAVIQAMHSRPQIDLWPPGHHSVEAAADRQGSSPT